MVRRWGTLDLLDVLKDSDFLADFSTEFTSVASREVIDRDTLRRRLLLCLFALGTNMGIKAIVATGEHGETEAALRHVRRHFINRDNLRCAIAKLVNATFTARDPNWWGTGNACASERVGKVRLRLFLPWSAAWTGFEATHHDSDHGPLDPGFGVLGGALVVAGEAAVRGDPGQGPLDDPTSWQHREPALALGFAHDVEQDPRPSFDPGHQFRRSRRRPTPARGRASPSGPGQGPAPRRRGPARTPR